MRKQGTKVSIRTLWGLAKSPELSLDDEDLYSLVERETGKDSLRALTQGELDRVAQILEIQKDQGKSRQPDRGLTDGEGRKLLRSAARSTV